MWRRKNCDQGDGSIRAKIMGGVTMGRHVVSWANDPEIHGGEILKYANNSWYVS